MIERIQEEKIPHGPLCVAFTPDEEIGTGASHFNVEQFGLTTAIHWTVIPKARSSTRTSTHVKRIS